MDRARTREVLAFLLIGGLSAGMDALVFVGLVALGVYPVLASAISFLSAFVVNFSGNRRIVFRARADRWQLVRYVLLVALNLALSAGLVAVGLAIGLLPWVAKAVSIVLIAVFNYFAMRQWVFRPSPGRARSEDQADARDPVGDH